ncbi:MAG: threonylcarbamoyl-AMP synthase [Planctomycetes bacterium]|nr:threonylcarbamoyl-AMP synthase [Planctomycetota bacterium]
MPATLLNVDDGPSGPELTAQVQGVLEAGGLALLPTETVYGIAARADDADALAALANAKGRPTEQPFTWHVGDDTCLDALGARTAAVDRLVQRYWPGPLTLVVPDLSGHMPALAKAGRVGVRYPAHQTTASILKALPFPVAMTSANLHGEEPVKDLDQLAPQVREKLALIIEGGPPSLGESSTVLRIGRAAGEERPAFELLREGLHDLETLKRAAGLRLLFVCTGNTCRSPMAEALARRAITRALSCEDEDLSALGYEVSSAGVYGFGGGPASRHSIDQMAARDIDITAHAASGADAEALSNADEIYCLTTGHLRAVQELLPPEASASASLLDPAGMDIPDPIGGSSRDYERCADLIAGCIDERLSAWV